MSIIYVDGDESRGADIVDFKTNENSGIEIKENGFIIILKTLPNGEKIVADGITTKKKVTNNLKWVINGVEYTVFTIGNNEITIKSTKDSLIK